MAEIMGPSTDILKLKNSVIAVQVTEVLQDVLVVSYVFGSQNFQGVLLDSSKRNAPCGVNLPTTQGNEESDLLHRAIAQRFTYFQNSAPLNGIRKHCTNNKKKKKETQMTVRLRPRHVLCSNCKSICNDKSENVDKSRKGKINQPTHLPDIEPVMLSSVAAKSPKPVIPEIPFETYFLRNTANKMMSSLVPKVPRLKPEDVKAINGQIPSSKCSPKVALSLLKGNYCIKSPKYSMIKSSESIENIQLDDDESTRIDEDFSEVFISDSGLDKNGSSIFASDTSSENMQSLFSEKMQDNCDDLLIDKVLETVRNNDDVSLKTKEVVDNKMVLRKRQGVGSMEDLWDESVFEDKQQKSQTTPVLKICFGSQGQGTILKIPSKVRNTVFTENDIDDSQTTKAARKAHKRAKKEAKKKLSVLSPTHNSVFIHKKHKFKRKEKHFYESLASNDNDKKLSISLKRLRKRAYTSESEVPDSSVRTSDSSDEVPDFPETTAVVQCVHATCTFYTTYAGKVLRIGDVIWGKAHGCPWWPGKILSFRSSTENKELLFANIAWFGSKSSSIINCDNLSPFLDTYKLRFNKHKKSGQYEEAIRQATVEAREQQNQNAGTSDSFPSVSDV